MAELIKRITLIVLDSVGCGDAPDAAAYGDEGSNTLSNISQAVDGLSLPNLANLDLGNITPIEGVPPANNTAGLYGWLTRENTLPKAT